MTLMNIALSAMTIIGALVALNAKDLMRGVMGMALFFTGIAGFFAYLGAYFLAVAQLFLFVGGVVTLFVLAFNMAPTPHLRRTFGSTLLLTLLPAALLLVLLVSVPPMPGAAATLPDIGMTLFHQYGWLVNVALLLLFSGLLGATYLLEERA